MKAAKYLQEVCYERIAEVSSTQIFSEEGIVLPGLNEQSKQSNCITLPWFQ